MGFCKKKQFWNNQHKLSQSKLVLVEMAITKLRFLNFILSMFKIHFNLMQTVFSNLLLFLFSL